MSGLRREDMREGRAYCRSLGLARNDNFHRRADLSSRGATSGLRREAAVRVEVKLMSSPNTSDVPSLTPSPGTASKRLLPWLVAVAFFMESLDTTILNTAVPAISAALHVSALNM